jgi:hypothetical protein
MMKPLPVDRSWRAMESSEVLEVLMEIHPEVSQFDLKKIRSKNFKIPRNHGLEREEGKTDRTREKLPPMMKWVDRISEARETSSRRKTTKEAVEFWLVGWLVGGEESLKRPSHGW